MYENKHMLNVALKRTCSIEQERAIKQAIHQLSVERLMSRGLRATIIEAKPMTLGTRWLDVHMTFDPESFGYTLTDFIIAMTVMINEVFVTYEPHGFCWWGLTATVDELKAVAT